MPVSTAALRLLATDIQPTSDSTFNYLDLRLFLHNERYN
jgi:hypothetical protein